MKTIDELKKNLDVFLAKFPNKATSWALATDEVKDMAIEVREILLGMPTYSFGRPDTPSDWNTIYKAFIELGWGAMNEKQKRRFYARFKTWLE